jgi:maltooligosyltrehalose trehalohydrolase
MHKFSVWAPKARTVAVKLDAVAYPMAGPNEMGYWSCFVETAAPGSEYVFLLDSDPIPYPDPRSAWQPHGVHGASRIFDHSAFCWTDQSWLAPPLETAILYELHVGTFTPQGTFDGVIEHLEYLLALGITHIQLMPAAEFPGDFGWGYDGVSLFAVRHQYGGPEGLKRLVNACHQCGLAVLLDVVYNHFGPVGNYTNKFGFYQSDRHRTPWGEAINFEGAGSDAVRRFFCDNALMFLSDYHFDGLRLDAVHELIDRSAIHFMEQLTTEVEALSKKLGRRLSLIAESDLNDPRVVTARSQGGYGMDVQWSDDFHHALFTVLYGAERTGYYSDFGSLAVLVKALQHAFVYEGQYSLYRGHSHGRPTDGLSLHRFLGFIQNHDQVGNRAKGDRIEHLIGMSLSKVAAGLVLTAPFIPMLFQGEEFAASSPFQFFAHHEDEEMAKAVSAGRRRDFAAFGWSPDAIPDPESRATLDRSKLNWDEIAKPPHDEMLTWYTHLIHLRRTTPCLNDGDRSNIQITFDEVDRWLIMERGSIQIICNLGEQDQTIHCKPHSSLLLASTLDVRSEDSSVVLPGYSMAITSIN